MKIDKVKLTAYALGELKGREAEELAAAIARDPEATRYVEEIKALARQAQKDLGSQALPKGEGSLPILKKIMKWQKRRPTEKQIWLQGGAVALALLVLIFASPLKRFLLDPTIGNVGRLEIGSDGVERGESDGPVGLPTERKKDVDAQQLNQDMEALAFRELSRQSIPRCQFALPKTNTVDKLEKDPRTKGLTVTYGLAETGGALIVTVDTSLQPLRRFVGVEEVKRAELYTYFRTRQGELDVTFSKVPDNSVIPFCWVRIVFEGRLSEAAQKYAVTLLEELGLRTADTMLIK